MKLHSLSDANLTAKLGELSKRDLLLTAEIVSVIHEFMVRRLYLEHGCTSIFGYLVDRLGYPRATAQNRIDAARLLGAVPEIQENLANGKINLSQIGLISMGIRQAEKENPGVKISDDQKRNLVAKIVTGSESKSEHASAQVVAKELDIKIPTHEKVRVHQDGSVTIEVHLSKEEFADLKRVRDLNSHKNHNAKLGETVAEAAKFFLAKKDPKKLPTKITAPKPSSNANWKVSSNPNQKISSCPNQKVSSDSNQKISSGPNQKVSSGPNQKVSSDPNQKVSSGPNQKVSSGPNRKVSSGPNRKVSSGPNFSAAMNLLPVARPAAEFRAGNVLLSRPQKLRRPNSREYISVHVVRAVHQRDHSCRSVDEHTGLVCGSTYQVQIDHIVGLADGGTNDISNLELKCGVHNRRKFELEL